MLEIDNFSSAVVDYAQNSISFNTARPTFGKSRVSGKAGFKMGSIGTYLPAAHIDMKLSKKLPLSVNAAGIISKGVMKKSFSPLYTLRLSAKAG